MLLVPVCIIVLACVGFVILTLLNVKGKGTAALFVKTSLSVLFILLCAWGATQPAIEANGLSLLAFFMLAGQVMGLLGDIWLDQKNVHASHKATYLIAGFSCFSGEHVFLLAGLLLTFVGSAVTHLLIPLVVALLMTLIIKLVEKPLSMDCTGFRVPVLLYAFIITAATVLSVVISVEVSVSNLGPFMACFSAGMVLFLLSDLVLSQIYFSKKAVPEKLLVPLNLFLYYTGQYAIAASLFFVPLS